jgi:hypothetical protein
MTSTRVEGVSATLLQTLAVEARNKVRFCHILLWPYKSTGPQRLFRITPSTLVDVIGKGVLPRLYEDLPNATAACEEFIRECVDLLVSGSIVEATLTPVKMFDPLSHVIDHDPHPVPGQLLPQRLFDLPLSVLRLTVRLLGHSIGGNGASPSETFTTFVEQIIIVLRMAVDRLDPAEQDVQVDLGDLMSMLAQYTSRLGASMDHSIRESRMVFLRVPSLSRVTQSAFDEMASTS